MLLMRTMLLVPAPVGMDAAHPVFPSKRNPRKRSCHSRIQAPRRPQGWSWQTRETHHHQRNNHLMVHHRQNLRGKDADFNNPFGWAAASSPAATSSRQPTTWPHGAWTDPGWNSSPRSKTAPSLSAPHTPWIGTATAANCVKNAP